jgi:hypothetical protein
LLPTEDVSPAERAILESQKEFLSWLPTACMAVAASAAAGCWIPAQPFWQGVFELHHFRIALRRNAAHSRTPGVCAENFSQAAVRAVRQHYCGEKTGRTSSAPRVRFDSASELPPYILRT